MGVGVGGMKEGPRNRAEPPWASVARQPAFLSFCLPPCRGPSGVSLLSLPSWALTLAFLAPRAVGGAGVVQLGETGGHRVQSADQLARELQHVARSCGPLLIW